MGFERLDDLCRESMAEVTRAAAELRWAMDAAAAYVNPQTWTGAPAERWATEFTGRMNAIRRLLDELPAEQRRLIEKARQDQQRLDQQRQTAV